VHSTGIGERVVEREPLTMHVGKSGAALERWLLDDGSRLVVKHLTPGSDLLMSLTDDLGCREYTIWASGLLDRLPAGLAHAVVDGWREADGAALAMRDLGDEVLTWEDRLDAERCRWVVERLAGLHDAFSDVPLERWRESLTDLSAFITLFSPERLRPYDEGASPIPRLAVRGWRLFEQTVPPGVSGPVLDLLSRPGPLVSALRRCPCTLVHGDFATVNLAVEPDVLVLLDWSMSTQAPGAIDVARFIAGCSSVVDLSRDEVIEAYADAAGPAFHEPAMRLALLGGAMWLGWNKALDAHEHPDAAVREREREDLDWWVRQARTTLRSGLL
jgi:hypothetical protein